MTPTFIVLAVVALLSSIVLNVYLRRRARAPRSTWEKPVTFQETNEQMMDLVKRAASASAQTASTILGDGATAVIMVGKNGRPHSYHWVVSVGSCLEVRGLAEQGIDVIRSTFHGTKQASDHTS